MKGRESGMPDETYWNSFFNPSCIVKKLDCGESYRGLVEVGCGYGLFTIPAAKLARGPVFAFDVEPDMVRTTVERVRAADLLNVVAEVRDCIDNGFGCSDASIDHVMLYNILHIENPVGLLREVFRVLVPGGKVSVIHWRSDVETPRGPSPAIRPRPDQCRDWGEEAGLRLDRYESLNCCSYHYGLVLARPQSGEATNRLG